MLLTAADSTGMTCCADVFSTLAKTTYTTSELLSRCSPLTLELLPAEQNNKALASAAVFKQAEPSQVVSLQRHHSGGIQKVIGLALQQQSLFSSKTDS